MATPEPLIPHTDAIEKAIDSVVSNPSPQTVAELLTTYDTSLAVVQSQHPPSLTAELADKFSTRIRSTLSTAFSQHGFSLIRGDQYDTRSEAQFLDATGSTTVFVQSIVDEVITRSLTTGPTHIPGEVTDYLLSTALTVDNPTCRETAALIGFTVSKYNTDVIEQLLSQHPEADGARAAEILRAAFHSTPTFPEHTSSVIPRTFLKEAYRLYRTDILSQTSPVSQHTEYSIDLPTEPPIDSGVVFRAQQTSPRSRN